jgi:riboflavin kinase/FMN adenylyltransferase
LHPTSEFFVHITRQTTDPLRPLQGRDAVVSIGVFDGVHLGHQAILAANRAEAAARGAVSTAVTFGDHPKALLLGRAPRTLTTLEHRLRHFERLGIEHAVVLEFNDQLRQTDAQTFVEDLLVQGLHATAFVLGFDSKFGRDRAGDAGLIKSLGHPVQVVPKVELGQRAVSSTAIREAVELGDLEGAARMLGRPVSVYGQVIHGDALGRQLGFPTANLDLAHELSPPPGVYACRAEIDPLERSGARTEAYPAVANIGYRPTVTGERPERPRVEAHLLEGGQDLYGRHLELAFVAKLRNEQRFEGIEELKAQIARDCAAARALL